MSVSRLGMLSCVVKIIANGWYDGIFYLVLTLWGNICGTLPEIASISVGTSGLRYIWRT